MKTSNKITLIAGLSAIALIGTGYAAWTFSKDATATADGNVNITTKAEEVGTLKLADGQSFVLTLDQDFIGWQKTANDNDTSDVKEIELVYSGSKAKDTKAEYAVEETIEIAVETNYGALSTYVEFGTTATIESQNYVGEDLTFKFTLPTVSYINAKYPRNEEAYDAMVDAIGSAKVEFTFTASVKECTHTTGNN